MIMIRQATWPLTRVRALTTTRGGGVSQAPYDALNLAQHVGDDAQAVAANRTALAAALALPATPCWLQQVHGSTVVDAGTTPPGSVSADGAFTTRPSVVCAVLTADCLPIVLAARDGTALAVLHAGWRGLAGGIIEAGVAALPVDPGRLAAWLGPAIGAADYEVGAEVPAAFGEDYAGAFRLVRPGKYQADLYAVARLRLRWAGVSMIYGGGANTFQDPELYSYRRDSVCGRMATLAWLLP